MGKESLWYDEAMTALSLRLPFSEMIDERLAAGHSPLYFILLYPIAKVFGTGEFVVRIPSVLTSALSIYLFFLLAKYLFSDRFFALVPTLFFTLSSLNIYFAQEARMYSMGVLFCIMSFYFLLRALEGSHFTGWFLYGLATVFMIYLSVSTIPIFLAQIAFIIIKKKHFTISILTLVFIAACYLPMGFFYLQTKKVDTLQWLTPISARTFLEIFYGFAFRPIPIEGVAGWHRHYVRVSEILSIVFAGGFVLFGIMPIFNSRGMTRVVNFKRSDASLLSGLWLLLPLVVVYLFSLFGQPILGPKRYIIALSPPFYLLIALGISNIDLKMLRTYLIVGFSILFMVTLFFFYRTPTKEDWRGAVAHIDRSLGSGEVLFGDLSTQTMYNYYGADEYLIILHINDLPTVQVSRGWILIRERGFKALNAELEQLRRQYVLEFRDDYFGLLLYHFQR
jgi:4-amino-4-deoxy-L-arabinose transferase-like glycosyltransferase